MQMFSKGFVMKQIYTSSRSYNAEVPKPGFANLLRKIKKSLGCVQCVANINLLFYVNFLNSFMLYISVSTKVYIM